MRIMSKGAIASSITQGGGAFSPDDVTGLQVWYDCSDSDTITESSNVVTAIEDKTGNGYDLSATSGNEPTYATNQVNGESTVNFDGAGDFMTASFAAGYNTANSTVFIVMDFDDATDVETRFGGTLYYTAGGGTPNYAFVGWGLKFDQYGGRPEMNIGDGDGGWGSVLGTNENDPMCLQINANASSNSSELFKDGTSIGTTTDSGYYPLDSDTNGELVIGGQWDDTKHCEFKMCEVLIYDSILGSSDVSDIEDYISDKWGITFS